MSKQYYTYIITNRYHTTLYIGVTSNLIRRIYQHKNKTINGFSSLYLLNKLVYYEVFEDPQNAIKREKTMKNMLRRKKEALIKSFNPEWNDLYEKIIQ